MKIITHNGIFHADEVFAVATLKLIYNEVTVTRTRNLPADTTDTLFVDVGLKYDGEQNFDHHQRDSALTHPNGIPMASFGLIWRNFGKTLVDTDYAYNSVLNSLVSSIDAVDNGIFLEHESYTPYTLSNAISSFNSENPFSGEQEFAFNAAVDFAQVVIENAIKSAKKEAQDYYYVLDKMSNNNGDVLVLDKYANFRDALKNSQIKYVIYPTNGEYRVQSTAPKWNVEAFTSDSQDFVFCHKSGFVFGTKTLELANELAKTYGK